MSATKQKLSINVMQEVDILRKIVEITNSEPSLKAVLHEIVDVVNMFTGADSVFIYLFDDKKKNLTLMASKTPHQKELGHVTVKVGEGITGWVAEHNKPVAISEDATHDKRFKSFDVLPEDKYEAFLSVPIVRKKKTIGVINIQHKKTHEYGDSTIKLISLIGTQIGGAIENAKLFDETQKKAKQFDRLVKVSESITSERYLDEILALIVVVTAEMLNSKICSIMLLDEKKKELSIKVTQSLSDEYKKKPNIKVDDSIIGKAIKYKRPIAVEDVQKEEGYKLRDLAIKENLTSMLAVPMSIKDRIIGVINIYTKEPHEFTKEEINVLSMVASQAAVAVENTKLVDEAVEAKEALETRKIVERAKGILMKMSDLDENSAHKIIHKKAMDSKKTMKEIAESIILMSEIQNDKGIK